MNALFGNLKTDDHEQSEDRLGGNYSAKETDIYTGDLKAFYAGQSSGGAHSITVILTGGDFGKDEYRETVYITSKKGENFYITPDKKKASLPGFTVIDDMCLATVGKSLSEVGFEEKIMNIYDYEAKKELPKAVQMAVELLGQKVSVAIVKSKENQTEKDGAGNYVPKADGSTRDVNNISKVFNTDTRMTVAEARAGATEPKFWDAWLEKNKGKTQDKTAKTGGAGNAGKPGGGNAGAPQSSGANTNAGAAPRTSLFGAKS